MSFWKICTLFLSLILSTAALAEATHLLRQPAVSADHIAFVYAGDLWLADRDGANSRRLTSSPAGESNPHFSPDGKLIAFAANHEGNIDVHVISIDGGNPTRLTWHPGDDIPVGWSADGASVAFASSRETDHGRSDQLYHVAVAGGAPIKQMEARFFRGQWSADGERLAYIDFGPAYNGLYGGSAGWRGYRGGTTPSIRVLNPSSGEIRRIPGERVNDLNPLWYGDSILFLSDRDDKIFNLFQADPVNGDVMRLTDQDRWDIRSAARHDRHVVFEAGGRLHEIDLETRLRRTLEIELNPDLSQLASGWRNVRGNIQGARISPTGQRVVVTARGEIFTVPVEHGSTRNLTATDGVREYPALWSPAGEEIAWIVESLDGQTLVIADQSGIGERREFELGTDFYQLLAWDANSGANRGRIVFSDNRLGLHVIDLDNGRVREIAHNIRHDDFDVAFSPGGRYLAYTLRQANYFRDLFIHDFNDSRSHRVTDGMADVAAPAFSPDGGYLYFAASTNSGPVQFGLDMSSQERPFRAGIYGLVLAAEGESPLAPRSSEEEPGSGKDDENGKDEGEDEAVTTRIDFDGLMARMVALPVAEGNYFGLAVAHDGSLIYIHRTQPGATAEPPGEQWARDHRLMRFDFDKREANRLLTGVQGFDLAAGRKHIAISLADGSLTTAEVGAELDLEALDLSELRMHINPRKEWAQIFDEGWRFQRDFFYAENLHGLDWDAVYAQYRPLLDHVGRREDLNELMVEMIAELHAGHNRVGGGDVYRESGPGVGLLGANFEIADQRWRISKVYSGEAWNPFIHGPLTRPGAEARAGEYILAINGHKLTANDNLFKYLHNTVDKQITLRVGPRADGGNARNIVVEPVGNESGMRLWSWVETNRQTVEQATDGRVGYIYLPNTAGPGYTFFNRMFYAQLDREAVIIDERSNGGGQAANYIVEVLSRRHLSNWVYRDGLISSTPMGALHGPKIMLIDQDAGSGGDWLPYAFRELEIGTLMGTRTWGGLIGIFMNPLLVDGGMMTVPYFRFVDTANNWSVENEGVAPDIRVELDPTATNAGRDSQLEAAISEILDQLENHRDEIHREPPLLPTELGR